MPTRSASIKRTTNETDIRLRVRLDGQGTSTVKTGLAFLDHMVTLVGTHGAFDLTVTARGDLDVDIHHTNEDVGLVLGEGLLAALDRKSTRLNSSH